LSSVFIAGVGLGLGVAGDRLLSVEQTRGSWAAWLLVGFGLSYAAVGLFKQKTRRHNPHAGSPELLGATPDSEALGSRQLMPALFVIFLLGPCEALLPLLTASGLVLSLGQAMTVTTVFSLATIVTMLTLVAGGYLGAEALQLRRRWATVAPYSHVLAGLALSLSGLSIQLLGI
jgi:hypothetical protein